MIKVLTRFSVVPKKVGRYAAFPTLSRDGDSVFLACRQGSTDEDKPHGDKGKVYLFSSKITDLKKWHGVSVDFMQSHDEGNELDAIVTFLKDGTLFLVSRHFQSNAENYPYISQVTKKELSQIHQSNSLVLSRHQLNEILSQNEKAVVVAAVFGHVLIGANDDCFMSCYAAIEQDCMPSPCILRSTDCGLSWQLHRVIARSDVFGSYLNETSLVRLEDGRVLAVTRTDNKPWPLYFSFSDDDMCEWSALSETGLYGHAPLLVKGEGEIAFLFYRDLSSSTPGVSCAYFFNNVWTSVGVVVKFENIYNGGYSDAIHLGGNTFFMVTYLDDVDASPWVDGFILQINI